MVRNRGIRKVWTYKGVIVCPAETNGSGIRWYAVAPKVLRADTKAGMRLLINAELSSLRQPH